MGRVQQGDEAALGVLMERWELPLKAVIGRLIFNATEAEELAQEAFVRVWQQRGKFRPEAAFRPWLFAIAINLARNRLRWWRRRPAISLEAWEANQEAVDGNSETGRSVAEQAERARIVRDAIAGLPAELREALVLSEYEQMAQAEIADAVGASVKAVETRIYRAREKLRVVLAGRV